MGDVPEKMNDTWMKAMHVGMIDRGYTVLIFNL
jgi:hypothetical protein